MPRKSARKSKRIQNKRKKGFSWRLMSKTKKLRKRLFRYATIAFLVIISVGFLGGLTFYRNLKKPFASAESSTSFDINSADLSTLLLITVEDLDEDNLKTNSIDLVIFEKRKNKVVSFEVPINWVVDVPGRYGNEELSKVLPVAMMNAESKEEAAVVLQNAVENKFAFNIDRFVLMDDDVSKSLTDTFMQGKSSGLLNYENAKEMAFSIVTNASLSEFYNYYSFVNGLSYDRFTTYNKSAEVLDESEFIQTVLRELTFDSKVAKEATSVAILNGTNVPGMAGFSAEVLENYGAHITEIGNANNQYEESVLVVSSKDLHVVKQIQRFFDIEKVILKEDFSQDSFAINRADVSLIIGLDTAESL